MSLTARRSEQRRIRSQIKGGASGSTKSAGIRRAVLFFRRLVNRRYSRAVVAGFCLVLIACSVGASALELRHGVSSRAVVRYFSRDRLGDENLLYRLRSYLTGRRIELLLAEAPAAGGGLVYAEAGSLRFYPWEPPGDRDRESRQAENLEIFSRLAPRYHGADLDGLFAELATDDVQARLREETHLRWRYGVLRHRWLAGVGEAERYRLLRGAAVLIEPFVPYFGRRYDLDLSAELGFYEQADPEGHFVGLFEIAGLRVALPGEDPHAEQMSRRHHFFSIGPGLDGAHVLEAHFRGTTSRFSIHPFEHPAGVTLYKVRPRWGRAATGTG